MLNDIYKYTRKDINNICKTLSDLVINTPLQYNSRLSTIYNCNVYLKREDLQSVRSFKIRGAYNKMLNLNNILIFISYEESCCFLCLGFGPGFCFCG